MRRNLLLKEAVPRVRRNALMSLAKVPMPTRRSALLARAGVSRMPTQFYNRKGRQFFLTPRGVYVVRENGKSLYGRKAAGPNAHRAPKAIRPSK